MQKENVIKWNPLFPSAIIIKNNPENLYKLFNTYGLDEKYKKDYEVSWLFLSEFSDVINSFTAYRRETERFLHWIWQVKERSLQEIHKKDVIHYLKEIKQPDPSWISDSQQSRFLDNKPNKLWRPFSRQQKSSSASFEKDYSLSSTSIKAMITILSSFFDFLIDEDFIEKNFIKGIYSRRKKRLAKRKSTQTKNISNTLTKIQWEYCLTTATKMANIEPKIHERTLFILYLLCRLYLRVSELVPRASKEEFGKIITPKMGDFKIHGDQGIWYLEVKESKGGKSRDITIDDEVLESLKRYRRHLGLSELPRHNEQTPLLLKLKGSGPIVGTRQIRNIIKDCFKKTIQSLKKDGHINDAIRLEQATPHWLRHTGISQEANDPDNPRPLPHIKEDAGHSDIATTAQYVDSELKERYNSKNKICTSL